jgi:FkbH-like protein
MIQVVSEDLSLNARQFFVPRLEVISGNWLGMDGYAHFGRLISLKLILSSIVPRIKLIAIDLDNTLYNGVLAEDGHQGISQSENQIKLVSWLFEQKDKGVMLAIVSRNQIEDVENLLATNPNWASLFDFIYANWEPKERLIDQILNVTRISQNAVLFLDDSHSEILNVQRNFPEMNLVQYYDNPETINFLKLNPGFNVKNKSNVAFIDRALDLKSNAFRASIFANSKNDEAFKALEVVLKFKKNEVMGFYAGDSLFAGV